MTDTPTVVVSSRDVAADPARIFELIADPSLQPGWDGNDNLAEATPGQRVHRSGDTFTMTLANGGIRENRIVDFEEGRVISWMPSEVGAEPPGHVWRWDLEPLDGGRTRVRCTYDWTHLRRDDEMRQTRARATTVDTLQASLERLAAVAES